jgi:Skp family chaperone for outer membrane proteins
VPKLLTTLAIVFATFSCALAQGQNTAPRTAPARTNTAPASAAPASSGTIVAVIDTFYVLRKHEKMVSYYEGYNKRLNESKMEFQAKDKELQKEKEKLRDLKVGSDEYRELMESIIQKEADHLAAAKVRETQFTEEKAKMEFEIYKEVESTIRNYANRKGIDLVINFNSEKPTFENPQSLTMAVRNSVQYHNQLDITLEVLEIVSPNHKMAGKTPPGKGGTSKK